MLFNTLAYAWFLGVVFFTSWVLAQPGKGLWAPWIAVVAFAAYHLRLSPASSGSLTPIALGVVAATGFATAGVERGPWRHDNRLTILLSCVLNAAGLGLLSSWALGRDPLSAAWLAMRLPSLPGPWQPTQLAAWLGPMVLAGASWSLLACRRPRLTFLLLASYVFYAHWDYRFLPLIIGSSSIDYWLGRKIDAASDNRTRKQWLGLTVVVNLGVLAFFKYYNFGIDSARAALSALDLNVPDWTLEVALPVGISFFTFESMSYVVDVYRRELPAHRSYLEYLTFVAFFPHLVAGPIVRPRDLLPQLAARPTFFAPAASEGLFLIGIGLLKKIAIGDYLALNLVERVFDAPTMYSSLECYAGVISYALQIYCDFSGYTDIAIGSALLLGVRFPLNFNSPYKADSIQDFWRRWHISLSSWLRDYLYIPLGGNRRGAGRTYVNLMLTMLLGGLWHGASWNFVIWGGLHGCALSIERALQREPRPSSSGWARWLRVALVFHFVCLAWIFFRASTFNHARVMLTQLSALTTFHPNLHPKVLFVLALGLVSHFWPQHTFSRAKAAFVRAPAPVQGAWLLLIALCLREMESAEAVPFVYFQF